MKTLYKRQFTGKKKKKNALYIQIFPISQQWFPKEDSVVKATHFFFFALVWYVENQNL